MHLCTICKKNAYYKEIVSAVEDLIIIVLGWLTGNINVDSNRVMQSDVNYLIEGNWLIQTIISKCELPDLVELKYTDNNNHQNERNWHTHTHTHIMTVMQQEWLHWHTQQHQGGTHAMINSCSLKRTKCHGINHGANQPSTSIFGTNSKEKESSKEK